ncbi:hypothetical protein Tco_0038994 [Tanacetum coccineum]
MIHELIINKVISIEFVRSQQNLANLLTNGLARDLVIKSVEGMGLKMCLEPAEKEDEVVNFLMVNVFENVLSRSMNKEEPPMYSNGLKGFGSYLVMGLEVRRVHPEATEHLNSDSGQKESMSPMNFSKFTLQKYPQQVNSSVGCFIIELSAGVLLRGLADDSGH